MPGPASSERRSILVYDADCGPCTRFKRLISLLNVESKIVFVSLRDADRRNLLDSVPMDLRYQSMHFVMTDRSVLSGSEAVPSILASLPGGTVLSGLLKQNRLGRKLTAAGYAAAARLRGRSCRTRS